MFGQAFNFGVDFLSSDLWISCSSASLKRRSMRFSIRTSATVAGNLFMKFTYPVVEVAGINLVLLTPLVIG